jgi:serralysin
VLSAGINGVKNTWADLGNTWNDLQPILTANAQLVYPVAPIVTSSTPQSLLPSPGTNVTVTGAGLDVLDLTSKQSGAYIFSTVGNGSLDLTTAGSSHYVVGVMQIQFADKTTTIAATNSIYEQVALLYQGALGRTPDAVGLAGWDKIAVNLPAQAQALGVYGLSDASANYNGSLSIAAGFTQSSEFINKYGALNDDQFVTQLYSNILDRSPDTAGFNGWQSQLVSGASREHVLVGFAESEEANSNATLGYTGVSGEHLPWLFLG